LAIRGQRLAGLLAVHSDLLSFCGTDRRSELPTRQVVAIRIAIRPEVEGPRPIEVVAAANEQPQMLVLDTPVHGVRA